MAEDLLQLNIREILKNRIPAKKRRWFPPFLISAVEKLIRQKELNQILRDVYPAEGSEFARQVLENLGITVQVEGIENLKEGDRYMFASNHPLGGLDGIALIATLGEKYGDDNIRFLVNDMLMNVTPLKSLFIPVNKYGKQGRQNTNAINETMMSDCQVFQFPAGLCSRLDDEGNIKDLDWQKSFVIKARQSRRDILPVHFIASNSPKFYKLARLRKKSGIKFNLEQILLPSELCKARGSHFKIVFGKPVPYDKFKDSSVDARDFAQQVKELSYSLAKT